MSRKKSGFFNFFSYFNGWTPQSKGDCSDYSIFPLFAVTVFLCGLPPCPEWMFRKINSFICPLILTSFSKNRQVSYDTSRFLANDSNFDRNPLRGCNYGLEGGAFLILGGAVLHLGGAVFCRLHPLQNHRKSHLHWSKDEVAFYSCSLLMMATVVAPNITATPNAPLHPSLNFFACLLRQDSQHLYLYPSGNVRWHSL